MYLLYSFLLALGFLILLPGFVVDALRHGKYVAGLRERFGFVAPLPPDRRPLLWLHCVSVGEVQAARPLFREIRRQFPQFRLAVSTVTVTGQAIAREVFGSEAEKVFYFPLDWRTSVRRSLRAINPAAILIMETEIWPRFLRECRQQSIATALVNGRISEKSFRRYQWLPSFVSQAVGRLDLAVMQSEADADRIRTLGMNPTRVHVSGSIKFDAEPAAGSPVTETLCRRFDLRRSPVIFAVSTHEPEERIILEAFSRFRNESNDAGPRLLIAPRHPERFSQVVSLLGDQTIPWSRRSAAATPGDARSEIILLDSIGELRPLFPLASIVFVGGSIARAGGHNILEPAVAGTCIITGPHTENFRDIVKTFAAAEAIVQVPPMETEQYPDYLAELLADLIKDSVRRQSLAHRAGRLVEENRGATASTMQWLNEMLTDRAESAVEAKQATAHT